MNRPAENKGSGIGQVCQHRQEPEGQEKKTQTVDPEQISEISLEIIKHKKGSKHQAEDQGISVAESDQKYQERIQNQKSLFLNPLIKSPQKQKNKSKSYAVAEFSSQGTRNIPSPHGISLIK